MGQGKLKKGRGEKGVNGGVRKIWKRVVKRMVRKAKKRVDE